MIDWVGFNIFHLAAVSKRKIASVEVRNNLDMMYQIYTTGVQPSYIWMLLKHWKKTTIGIIAEYFSWLTG